jgi:hypothetical protein
VEHTRSLSCLFKHVPGLLHRPLKLVTEPRILGEAEDVIEVVVLLAHLHQGLATKAGVSADRDLDLGPLGSELSDHSLEILKREAARRSLRGV